MPTTAEMVVRVRVDLDVDQVARLVEAIGRRLQLSRSHQAGEQFDE